MPLPARLTELVYAASPVELRLVIVEIDTIAADFFQIVANLLSVFRDRGFASAFEQITAKLHFHLFLAPLNLAQLAPAGVYFFTKFRRTSDLS